MSVSIPASTPITALLYLHNERPAGNYYSSLFDYRHIASLAVLFYQRHLSQVLLPHNAMCSVIVPIYQEDTANCNHRFVTKYNIHKITIVSR